MIINNNNINLLTFLSKKNIFKEKYLLNHARPVFRQLILCKTYRQCVLIIVQCFLAHPHALT
jgi:hypothetical protein